MAYVKGEPFKPAFSDVDGEPLALGSISFFDWNTNNPTPFYTDDTGTSGGTSVVLDILGKPDGVDLFYDSEIEYKFFVKDRFGTTIDTLGPYRTPLTSQFSEDLANTSDPALGDALVGVKRTLTDAVAMTLHYWIEGAQVSIRDFGAISDGVTDDYAAIVKAMAAVEAMGGGTLVFPAGKSTRWDTTVAIDFSNITIWAVGATLIPPNATNGLEFFNASTQREARVYGGKWTAANIRPSGSTIKFLNYQDVIIAGAQFYNQFNGMELAGVGSVRVVDCTANEYAGSFIWIDGGDTIQITNCVAGQAATRVGSRGIHVKSGGGIYITGCDMVRGEYGLALLPLSGSDLVSWVFISNSSFDSGTYGLYASSAGTNLVRSIHSSNSWYSSNTEQGMRIAGLAGVDGVSLSNDTIIQNGKEGAFFGGTSKNISIDSGTVIADNSVTTLNTYSGAFFDANTDYISVHAQFINGYAGATVNNQKYGIETNVSTLGNFECTGARFKGMLTAPILFQRDLTKRNIIEKNISDITDVVASAANITVDNTLDMIALSGTTNVTSIGMHTKGRRLTIVIGSTNTIVNGGNLVLGSNFTGNAGSVLDLISDGTVWRQTGRLVL